MKPQVKNALAKLAIFIGVIYCFIPGSVAAIALLAGLAIALTLGNPLQASTKNYSAKLLAYSVAGLGAGINLMLLGKLGLASLGVTALTIFITLLLGQFIARALKAEPDTSILISVGTAICGGSAIAAASSALKTKSEATTVALGTVFILNAIALFIFPPIGHFFDLSQFQFGLWSAIAIHDTSSVVGASLQYGAEALQVGTTVKLARARWIVPVTLALA
ncbi:MAG: putative sulfate exporter family transporter, partial [Bdellovibrionota bacterium]